MNYSKIYKSLVENCKSRKVLPEYYEAHHIVPRCMGGGDNSENIVKFTPREHYIAHRLLSKIYPEVLGLKLAVVFLAGRHKEDNTLKISSKVYERLRIDLIESKRLSCMRAGTSEISYAVKIPKGVSNRIRWFDIRSMYKSTLYLLVVNLIAVRSIALSKKNSYIALSCCVGGNWRKIPSKTLLWGAVEFLEKNGYVVVESCTKDVPFPLRKRASVTATDKLIKEFESCDEECQSIYYDSLVLTKFRILKTKEIYYSLPFTK